MIFNLRALRALNAFGGRFSSPQQLALIAEHHKRGLDLDVKRFTYFLNKNKRYWFSFCQSPQVNAFAASLGGDKYFLSLTSGLTVAMYLAAMKLATRSSFFSNLLDRDSRSIPVLSPRTRKFHQYWEQHVHSLFQNYASFQREPALSAPQAQLAFTIAHFALEFTLAHEVGHILGVSS